MTQEIKIPRWYYLYFVLAAFDVAAVATSLYLNHQAMGAYEESVTRVHELEEHQAALLHLIRLAALIDAPGNDVFNTRDPEKEERRLDDFWKAFEEHLGPVKHRLLADVDLKELVAEFESVGKHAAGLREEALHVFGNFRQNDEASAAVHMAAMDAHYANLSNSLSNVVDFVSGVVRTTLEQNVERAQRMRNIEIIIALMILMMVAGATFYGYKLSQRVRRDIARQMEAEEKLRLSEERLQLAVSGSEDGLWDWNVTTSEVYYSPRFMALTGHGPHELPHSFATFENMLHPEDRKMVKDAITKHFKTRGAYSVEYRLQHKDGRYIWCHARGQAIWGENGRATRMTGFTMDISARKEAEKQLQDYAQAMSIKTLELAEAKDQAENAARLKAEFLANMSHEIRTPMNGVIGMTNLLLDGDLKAAERGYAETILHSADALLQIINDILDFSKIEAGKISLEHISFDLQLLCEEVAEMMSYKAAEKRIELLLNYPRDVPRYVIGDPGRMRQILLNLLTNAIKFTDTGHVLLSVAHAATDDGRLRFHIEVEDTGMGIPEDKLDYIFNKFSQADGSTTRKFGGTGLGLSICKELARMMEGKIGVRSAYGVGSTFWFEIVLAVDAAGAALLPAPELERLQGLRGLIVDDNETARTIIREQLAPYGITVVMASSASQALEMAAAEPFDFATLDYRMPQMDGLELARRLKDNPKTHDMMLIMVTSAPNRGDKQKMEAQGFAAYFNKPLLHWYLRDALAVWVQARQAGTLTPLMTQYTLKEMRSGHTRDFSKNMHFHNVHLLLVEDNPVNQVIATTMLEKYGCRVTPAGDGSEAVKQVKQHRYDLILMDCQMPVMDGYEATETIRRLEIHQKRERTPIVAFTAHALSGDADRCFFAGMDDYITKPARQHDLERVLLQWLPADKRTEGIYPQGAGESGAATVQSGGGQTLDMAAFGVFKDILGDSLHDILEKHIEIAGQYVESIVRGCESRDFKVMREASHAFKSSSAQVGTLQVAELAADIERLSAQASPDVAALQSRVAALKQCHTQAIAALRAQMANKAA